METRMQLSALNSSRVFWHSASADSDETAEIISDIDTSATLKMSLGAPSWRVFLCEGALDDVITDVTDRTKKSGAAVGVVVEPHDRQSPKHRKGRRRSSS